jgi:hypothetical protein
MCIEGEGTGISVGFNLDGGYRVKSVFVDVVGCIGNVGVLEKPE